MLLFSCSNLSRGYDATPLFSDVGFEVFAGDRIGFVGPNGAGKTTLLRVLAGLDDPETGKVQLHAGARLGLLRQEAGFPAGRSLFAEAKSALDELVETQREFERVAEELSTAADETTRKQLSAKFDRLSEQLTARDAYQLDHKVEDVLSGLGFKPADYDRDLNTFSGGQQRRLLLAKMLLSAPDVMLLDEPSNHLDIATTQWLEGYLVRQPQGMILVSHDRFFLDKVTTRTLELHSRKVTAYPGNYTQYVRLREEKYLREMKEYEAQKEYIGKQEEYIRRAHYGQLAKQAQSRVKTLDKLDRVEKPKRVEGPGIRFGDVSRSGDVVFSGEDLTKRYDDKLLFENLNFDIQRGKRLAIMGPNGCGKTTLLKILLGDEEPTSGKVYRGHLVHTGYLDQHLKMLDETKTVVRAIWPDPDESLTEQKMRDLLGRFGLHGEVVEQTVGTLSGGEKSRAALAKLTIAGANVLVLDEPTNHLDIWACDALEEAVKAFEGTVIVVSHDRYFLNRVADLLLVMEPGKTEVVYGNYDTYELLRAARELAAKGEAPARPAGGKKAAAEKAEKAPASSSSSKPRKKRKYPFKKPADVEAEIAAAEARVIELEKLLQDVELYKDPPRFSKTLADLDALQAKLPGLYEHWEEAVEFNN